MSNPAETVQTSAETRWSQVRRWLMPAISLAIFIAVGFVIHHTLATHHLRDVLQALGTIPRESLSLAALFTLLSYATLTLYDASALRYCGHSVPYSRTALTSFTAYAFGHNLSLASFTGAALRYRLYGGVGLTAIDIATVVSFCALTTGIGVATIGGVSLVAGPLSATHTLHLHVVWARSLGVLLLGCLGAYVLWASFARRPLILGGWRIKPPGVTLALRQVVLGTVDLSLAAAVLWILLPPEVHVPFIRFAGAYAIAVVAGVVSNVPGGLGVFESVVLLAIPEAPPDVMLASLLAYRGIYYLGPLTLAALLFAGHEFRSGRKHLGRVAAAAANWVTPVAPQIVGILVFMGGAVLLVSGATPAIDARLVELRRWLPLPILELSHLIGSVIGVALLILARGLFRRLTAAYHATVWLLAGGIVASLLKGLDFEEAAILGLILLVARLGRSAFYRPASLMSQRFSPAWIASVVIVILTAGWFGFLAHRHVDYSHDLWWTFAFDADAPRMLRAMLVAAVATTGFVALSLFRPAPPEPAAATEADMCRARKALAYSTDSTANVALTGDKRFLFAEADQGFVMYQVAGRSWVALGDPVGRREQQEELVWQFRELSDRHGGWTVFYQVGPEKLGLYVDLGLALIKLGEEARVPLADFSLEGSARADLRQAHRRAERDGASFEVIPPERIAPLMPQLSRISQEWLDEKATHEKAFSLGSFSPQYVQQFPLAIVRSEGSLVAFANLWPTPTQAELSVDLMRFGPGAPRGAMDYLFTELMMWGRTQGYHWFNLGMAPLAGLDARPLAPSWRRLGNFVYRYGENFYNFEGLRHYKEKFNPVWQPKYLAYPGSMALPRILLDVASLISGGLKQMVSK